MKNYGELIKKARNSKGIKSSWMAEQLGIHFTSYSELEAGRRRLTVERAEAIAHILGMSLNELFCPQVSESPTCNNSKAS